MRRVTFPRACSLSLAYLAWGWPWTEEEAPVPLLLAVRFSCTCHGCAVGVAVRRVSGSCVRERQEGPTPPYNLLFQSAFCCADRQATVWWNRCFAECEVTWRQCCFSVTNSDGSFLPICCFLSVLLFAVLILRLYFIPCCFSYSFLLFSALLSCVFFVLLWYLFSLLFFSVRLFCFSLYVLFSVLLLSFIFCFLLLLSLPLFSVVLFF